MHGKNGETSMPRPARQDAKPQLRAAYDPHDPADYATKQDFESSMTEQSHKEGVDINNIMERFTLTGVIEHVQKYQPIYGDFVSGCDFQENMEQIARANSMFQELPAAVRERFGNDTQAFLNFIDSDPDYSELIDLGLMDPGTTPPVNQGSVSDQEGGNATETPEGLPSEGAVSEST